MGLSVFVSISTMCEPALGLNWDLNCVSDTYRMPSLMMELAGSGLLSPLSLPIANSDKSISPVDRKSTRLNSSHANISYAVFCLKKKKKKIYHKEVHI